MTPEEYNDFNSSVPDIYFKILYDNNIYNDKNKCIGCDGHEYCQNRKHMCKEAKNYKQSKYRSWKLFRKTEYKN